VWSLFIRAVNGKYKHPTLLLQTVLSEIGMGRFIKLLNAACIDLHTLNKDSANQDTVGDKTSAIL